MKHGHKNTVSEVHFQCQECEYSNKDKNELKTHIETLHTKTTQADTKFECFECSLSVKNKKDLKSHVIEEHKQIVQFDCSFCNFSSALIVDLQNHTTQYHSEATGTKTKKQEQSSLNLPCDNCHLLKEQNSELKRQMSTESTQTVQCHFCGVILEDVQHLQKHVADHHSTRQCVYACHFCGQVFTFANELQDHTLTAHNSESQILPQLKRIEEKNMTTDDAIFAVRADLNILINEFSIMKNKLKPAVEQPSKETDNRKTDTSEPNQASTPQQNQANTSQQNQANCHQPPKQPNVKES